MDVASVIRLRRCGFSPFASIRSGRSRSRRLGRFMSHVRAPNTHVMRWRTVAAAVVLLLPGMATMPNAADASIAAVRPYDFSREKALPGTQGPLPKGFSTTEISVKFRTERQVRVRGKHLVARVNADATAIAGLLSKYPGADITPLSTRPENQVTAERLLAEKRLGRGIPDLNSWFVITVPKGIESLLIDLNALPCVELARARPLTRTPSEPWQGQQKYRNPVGSSAGTGIDADYAGTVPGGKGDGVTVYDVEGDDADSRGPSPANSPGSLAASASHTLMVSSESTVYAWGDNSKGQLGDGTTTSRTTMVQVNGLTDVKAVAAGDGYSVALKNDGTVWTWGDNARGQLGNGTTTSSSTPIKVGDLPDGMVTSISAGRDGHVLAVLNTGSVAAWGEGGSGQLGNGSTNDSTAPVTVSVISNAVQVSSGGYHSLARLSDGSVKAWGFGVAGQLGDGGTDDRSTPVPVSGLTSGVTDVSAGTYHSAAVCDGKLWTWGDNSYGQLGTGSNTDSSVPVEVPRAGTPATIATGQQHTVAVFLVRVLKAWGGNDRGQLGNGTTSTRTSPLSPITLMNVWNSCHEELADRRPAPAGPPVVITPLAGGPCKPGRHGTPVVGIVGPRTTTERAWPGSPRILRCG
ncbi:RCC1 domain-containing protein [Actinomadura rupiterrae]|uniref:RCC1 domain-containing protein n=1 Tax=Actinomadura rupiterrae TaxID=559627 RepID=UPI0020A23871|nr:hypothetical protein [Actinomadura rupiterrae]MCP2341179.1 hypothetical protein [Actinomadura rupiterrae]